MNTRLENRERWRRLVGEQRASGLSITAFCRRAGVSHSSFYLWRKKLEAGVAFTEVRLRPQASRLEVRLPGRRSIVVRSGFDQRTLIALLAVLEATPDVTAAREAGR